MTQCDRAFHAFEVPCKGSKTSTPHAGQTTTRNRILTFKVRSASSPPPGSLILVGNSYFLLNVAPSSTNLRFLSYPGHGLPSFSQRAQAGCLLSHYSSHGQHRWVFVSSSSSTARLHAYLDTALPTSIAGPLGGGGRCLLRHRGAMSTAELCAGDKKRREGIRLRSGWQQEYNGLW
jgi:hypothetical protein